MWTARRLVPLVDTQQQSEYECTFEWETPTHGHVTFSIWHVYDKGAAELARRVISVGSALMEAHIDSRRVS
jgi:hypothetical protein